MLGIFTGCLASAVGCKKMTLNETQPLKTDRGEGGGLKRMSNENICS